MNAHYTDEERFNKDIAANNIDTTALSDAAHDAARHKHHDKAVTPPLWEAVGNPNSGKLAGLRNSAGYIVPVSDKTAEGELAMAIYQALDELDSEHVVQWWQGTPTVAVTGPIDAPTTAAAWAYRRLMRSGLLALLEHTSISGRQSWLDAVEYCRAVALDPQDTVQRAHSRWVRSCSDLHQELMTRFGPATVSAARDGSAKLVADHYQGRRLNVSHVDKKANFKKYSPTAIVGAAYYPTSSPLAVGCYESGALPCSLLLSGWLSAEEAVKLATLSHIGVCDDYGSFTLADEDVRLRLVAQGLGAVLEFGGQAVDALVDNSVLQGVGTSNEISLRSAMAWRAVSGGTTMYNGHIVAGDSIEQGLVAAEVMIATHDLFDWRSDVAGGNWENVFSVAYALNIENPFHTFLETILRRAAEHPRSGAYAIAPIGIMTFTACRYSSFNYLNLGVNHEGPCPECVRLTKVVTAGAGLAWAPKSPPNSHEEGHEIRKRAKIWVDRFEDQGLVQEGMSWFQDLINTGKIWVFDASLKMPQIDTEAGWA
ncbi:hypothetical protein PT974_07875 [Cladobotryum mycophilum]|uniref:Uncharacterized protein n=1 Tax=Cladobotryum mycophilum TaxID=491253 RepID=A0ABR0SBT4_9HYPO